MTQLLSFDVDQVMGGDKTTMAITLFFDTDLDRPVIKGLQISHGLISMVRQFNCDWPDHDGNRDRCLSPEKSEGLKTIGMMNLLRWLSSKEGPLFEDCRRRFELGGDRSHDVEEAISGTDVLALR